MCVGGRAIAIALSDKENFPAPSVSEGDVASSFADPVTGQAPQPELSSFLRIPPFPKARVAAFSEISAGGICENDVVDQLRNARVGGTYWAAQPSLPDKYVLVREPAAIELLLASGADRLVLWTSATLTTSLHPKVTSVTGECDPWFMLAGASMLVTDGKDDLCLIASILGIPVYRPDGANASLIAMELSPPKFPAGSLKNPFTGEPMTASEAIQLCAFWRRLIDSNRHIAGAIGFAFWKQDHIAPLLWGGRPVPFIRRARELSSPGSVAIWRARASDAEVARLEEANVPVVEVEDGFLRSRGLGADCVPPLSITVDRLGAYFDPAQASELEVLLQEGRFDRGLLARAARLREAIVAAGIGKYERSSGLELERPAGTSQHILVPGQVEDDRAVRTGGCGLISNRDLLARVRAAAPDAYIIYKPHPDVLAGHRRGEIAERACLDLANEIATDIPISSLIAIVDEVHVNTSLAGFEALLRGKPVVTYGVPFYAGWGLTRDNGPVPARRTARPNLDELVAASLLVYPRYVDPVTGLPCPAEIVVERLTRATKPDRRMFVQLRRLQGRLMRKLRSVGR